MNTTHLPSMPKVIICVLTFGASAVAEPSSATKEPAAVTREATQASVAAPEVDKQAKAKELFTEGRRLANEALYEKACPLFEQSLALENRPSTQFNLAECWERLGKLASAQVLYMAVAQAMHATGDITRENVAQRRAELLVPRLCGLSIEPQKPEPGLEIFLADKPFESTRWGIVAPTDPGTYAVRATAPGRKPWSTEVEVEACPTLVSVTIPGLEMLPKKAPAAATVPASAKPTTRRTVPQTFYGEESGRFPVIPAIVAGAGAGALAFGTVFAAKYGSKNDDAKAVCPQGIGCSRAQIELHEDLVDDAKTARAWAMVGFGVGGAALVTATVLYFTGDYGAHGPSYGRWSVAPLTAGGADTWGAAVSTGF